MTTSNKQLTKQKIPKWRNLKRKPENGNSEKEEYEHAQI